MAYLMGMNKKAARQRLSVAAESNIRNMGIAQGKKKREVLSSLFFLPFLFCAVHSIILFPMGINSKEIVLCVRKRII